MTLVLWLHCKKIRDSLIHLYPTLRRCPLLVSVKRTSSPNDDIHQAGVTGELLTTASSAAAIPTAATIHSAIIILVTNQTVAIVTFIRRHIAIIFYTNFEHDD